MPFRTLLFAFLLGSAALAQPSTLTLGAVLSQTGAARPLGQAQAQALTALARERGSAQRLQLVIRDDASSPEVARHEVRRLIDEGVDVLICCSTARATAAIAQEANAAGVPTLALSDLPEEPGFWLFTVKPDRRHLLRAAVLFQVAKGQHRFGLMTLEGAFGEAVARDLALLIDPESAVRLVVEERYPANATVLTPEALWVATRLPETVFVWGTPADTALALEALRARGYGGEVVVSPEVLADADAPGLRASALRDALVPVAPSAVADTLPPSHLTYGLTQAYLRAVGARAAPEGAYAYDAWRLVQEALEQAYTYGVASDDPQVYRSLLRDALIGMGPVAGAAASYDYREDDHVGVLSAALVLARLQGGRLVYAD